MEAPTFSELQNFTLNYYMKLLKYLAGNYRIIPFCDVRYEDTPYLILRHDIDVSLSAALTMAEMEKRYTANCGTTSGTTSPDYRLQRASANLRAP